MYGIQCLLAGRVPQREPTDRKHRRHGGQWSRECPHARIAENWAISAVVWQLARMSALTHVRAEVAEPIGLAKGDVRFLTPEERSRLRSEITSTGFLIVEVPSPPWMSSSPIGVPQRSKFRDVVDSAIESALEAAGAPSAGVSGFPDLDQCLSDQLFRARSIGASGLALFVPYLAAAGNLAGALDAEDSAVLRWWIAAAVERPVLVLLDPANRRIGAYGPPIRLEMLIEGAAEAPPKPQATDAEPIEALAPANDATVGVGAPPNPGSAAPSVQAGADAPGSSQRLQALAARVDAALAAASSEKLGERLAAPETRAFVAKEEPPPRDDGPEGASSSVAAADAPRSAAKALFANRVVPRFPRREIQVASKAPAFAEKGGAFAASLDWRGFANELSVAR